MGFDQSESKPWSFCIVLPSLALGLWHYGQSRCTPPALANLDVGIRPGAAVRYGGQELGSPCVLVLVLGTGDASDDHAADFTGGAGGPSGRLNGWYGVTHMYHVLLR